MIACIELGGRLVAAAALALLAAATASADPPKLALSWPQHWEYLPPREQGSVVQLRARRREDGRMTHRLDLTVIDAGAAKEPITADSIKDLVGQLRDVTLRTSKESSIPLRAFTQQQGFYFSATDKHDDSRNSETFHQFVSGAMLRSGYLINFTLLTDNTQSRETQEMMAALDALALR